MKRLVKVGIGEEEMKGWKEADIQLVYIDNKVGTRRLWNTCTPGTTENKL